MKLTTGASTSASPRDAAAEAVRAALDGVADPAFALVLSTDQYDPDALASAVTHEMKDVQWAGCCTAGVFAGRRLLTQGLVVGVVSSPGARFAIGVGGPVSRDGRAAGRAAVASALASLPPSSVARRRAIVLLPDALTGNAVDVVRGAAEEAGSGVVWAGGGAGDNLRFVRTAQYAHGRALSDHVVALVLDSPLELGAGIRHGWRPYGPPTLVTHAEGATAFELEYEEAFDVYRRTAAGQGDHVSRESFAAFAMSHPLGIPQADGEHVLRDPLSVGDDGSLRCVAEVPEGSLVRVMQGDRDALLGAARWAAREARESAGGPLGGAFVFDCVSRALLLGDGVEEELAAIQAQLGHGVPVVGCLTFGEVGALGAGAPEIHNKTTVLLALPS